MKVAFDVGPLKARPAGVGVYVRSLANALATLDGVEITLVGRRGDAIGLPDGLPEIRRDERVPYPMWVELAAPFSLGRENVELVHFTDGLVPLIRRRPSVVTVLDLSIVRHWRAHRFVRYPRIPLVLFAPRLATRVLVPSQATADEVIRLTGTSARRIDVIPLAAVEREPFVGDAASALKARGLSTGSFLLVLGTIEPRKNHVRVVAAFERLVTDRSIPEDIDLVIAGQPGWHSAPALRAIAESRVANRIKVLGYVPDEEVPVLLSNAAAVVYASTYEGFGLPVLEALGCGASVVTSNVSSMPEVAGDAAFLVDPHDAAAIARGIHEAISAGPDVATRARAQADLFSWRKAAEGTYATYLRALAR
jgi:glycosyltransferase involved in cell wall biosynthesis